MPRAWAQICPEIPDSTESIILPQKTIFQAETNFQQSQGGVMVGTANGEWRQALRNLAQPPQQITTKKNIKRKILKYLLWFDIGMKGVRSS